MKEVLLFLYLLFPGIIYAQVNDDFSDANFTSNPLWNGSNAGADFTISDNKLRSNSNTANTSFFLSTASALATETQWEIWVNLQFSTSSANYADIYVISDKADLKAASINGYFIRIGNTDDEISLYKRSGLSSSSIRIIDGVNGSVGSSNNTIRIRLKRDINGRFTLEREIVTAGSSYFTEGTVVDLTHITTTHFGILIQQSTSSFFLKHFFDNIKIEPIVTDNNPPVLVSVSSIDSTALEVLFSESMDSLTVKTTDNFSVSSNVIIAGILTTSDPTKFIVKLANSLSTGTYNFVVLNVKDRNGNLIAGNSQSFTYVKPYLAKPGDIVINELLADPSPQIALPMAEFVELRNNTVQKISLKDWKFSDPGSSATLGEISIDPGSFIILCARADTGNFKLFGKTIGLSPWPSLNNANDLLKLINPANIVIDTVNYADTWYRSAVKKTGGWTLERKDPKSRCEGFLNWFPSLDTAGGTPGRENSIYTPGTGLLALYADSLKQLSDTTVRLIFNKALNSSALAASSFTLTPSVGILKKITTDEELKQVTLLYGAKFTPGTDYQLHISDLTDCSGVLIAGNQDKLKFKTSNPPVPVPEKPDNAIIHITEIFADPSPEIHLPLVEFVELYNPSKDTIDLDKWSLSDPTTKALFPKQKLLPLEYVILCPAADTLSYIKYGRTIGLNPWPTLNNSSDLISLKSFSGRVVDSVAYSDTWYHIQSKKAGGWSLEKIDLKSPCIDFLNWTASADTMGGTPGKINSVEMNRTALKADSVRILSDTTIRIFFNKPLYEASLLTSNFNLAPRTSVVKKLISEREAREVSLTWQNPLQPDTGYELSISNIRDCSGNTLLTTQSLKFKTPSLPKVKSDTGRVLITEIFADPSPEIGLPLVEFIELYNPGTDTIDLSKWTLNDAVTKSLIPDKAINPGEYLILCPVADTLSLKPYGKVIGLSPWPALGNNMDKLTIKSFDHRVVDSVTYSDQWYKNRVKKNGGWSLERISLLNASCKGFYNWTSSIHPSGGTPGRINSRYNALKQNTPRIDSIKYTSDSTIIISFSAVPDTSYLKPAFFSMNNGLGNTTRLTVSDDYQEISLRFGSGFKEGVNYLLSADSLFNCSGQKSGTADSQISFKIPAVAELDYPVVINEIFADPSPSAGLPEIEFVELYNPTGSVVSLKGMIYGDEGSEYKFTSGHIAPHSYLILCPEKDTLNFVKLGKVHGLNVWPPLNNEKDILFLKNNKGRELQKVSYTTSWYKDPGKKSGGYSLEMISSSSLCTGVQNWRASLDPSGGTPGKINSVYSNSLPELLKLQAAALTDSTHLLLTFNHAVDSLSAMNPLSYSINNGVGKPSSVNPLAPDFNSVILTLKSALPKGYEYTIEVQDVHDCSGSVISKEFNRTTFILTKSIKKSDILISEILFNPRTGGSDFVEIYNNAEHDLDLRDLSIGTIVKDSISHVKTVRTTQTLITPGQYFALTTDPYNIDQEYFIENPNTLIKIASLPPFNDNTGTVLLIANNNIIDRFSYTEKMHFQLLKNFEGISLERSRFDIDANAAGNFRSATAASGFATPGYKNSQYSPTTVVNDQFLLTSRTFSPDSDGFEDYLEVNYKMERPGMIANVKVVNDNGNLVRTLLKNFTLNIQGVFTWDGLDDKNTLSGTGIYIIYAEIFDENGTSKWFRKSFALATKL